MTRVFPGLIALAVFAGACGGGGGGTNTNAAEHLSDELLRALGGDPDYRCLGAPDDALTFPTATVVTGVVEDFEGQAVPGVTVSVYASLQDATDASPFDTSAPSGNDGSYSITVPPGIARVIWRSEDGSGSAYDTIELNDPVAGFPPGPPQTTGRDRLIVDANTINTIPATLGIALIDGRGIIGGTLYDCARTHVEEGALRVYDAPESDPNRALISIYDTRDRNTFYFANGLPSRLQTYTDPEAQWVVANLVAPATVTVEFWGRLDPAWTPAGYDDCSAGCLIARQQVPVLPDTVVISDLEPLRQGD